MVKAERDEITIDKQSFNRSALLEQMERVLESKHFRNSKRYPMLLRYVVEQTLEGRTEVLKERTLGMEVFGRAGDYETNADPIVRVTAGEVRKRLAQYYQESGHETEVRIDLPLGAYVPHFYRPGTPGITKEIEKHPILQDLPRIQFLTTPEAVMDDGVVHPVSPAEDAVVETVAPYTTGIGKHQNLGTKHFWLWSVAACVLLLVSVFGLLVVRQRRAERGMTYFWQEPLSSPSPFTIAIGVHSLDLDGHEREVVSHVLNLAQGPTDMLDLMVRSDMVPVSDIVSYSRITDVLAKKNHAYTTMGSSDVTIEQIRSGPVVLIGGLDNLWTLRLTSKLRYRFEQKGQTVHGIIDSEHPETVWRLNYQQQAAATTEDFAIVASYFDTTIDQSVLVVAGIGKAGTQVAGEFVTNRGSLQNWLAQAHPGSRQNVEIVLSTAVVDGKAGPPKVIASAVW